MTEQANPCLPECQPNQAVRQERFHAPACPNAPKASEAPGYAAPVSVLGHADKVRNEYLAIRARLAEVEAERDKLQERNDNQTKTIQNWFREHEENAACNGSPEHQRIWFISKTSEHNDCPLCKAEAERDALRQENSDLKRRVEMLESDRSREANPDSRS